MKLLTTTQVTGRHPILDEVMPVVSIDWLTHTACFGPDAIAGDEGVYPIGECCIEIIE